MTKAEIQENVGGVLGSIEGVVTRVYDRKEGESEHGPWSFQGATLKLANNETVDIKFKNFPDDQKFRQNKRFHAKSTIDGKNKRNGLNVESFKDKPQVIVNHAFAEIVEGTPQPAQPGQPTQTAPPHSVTEEEALAAAKKYVAHNLTMAKIVIKAAHALKEDYHKTYGEPMPAEMLVEMCKFLVYGAERNINLQALPTNIESATLKIVKPAV